MKATAQMGGLTMPGTVPTLIADLTCAANGSYTENYVRALCERAAAKLQAIDRWVSVSERLPEMDGKSYLVFGAGYHPERAEKNGLDIETAQSQARWYNFARYGAGISHWMPLPPPPERP